MAKAEVDFYGNQDIQVSEGGEADLQKNFLVCKKNPGHTKFIPVDKFTLNHLPEGHRDKDLYELIKATADLTVRVDVKMTSPHRPEFWLDTKVTYPFYNLRGKANLRTGSGMVCEVYKFKDGYFDQHETKHDQNYTQCWCTKCKHSDTASRVWWEFILKSAVHVVFDDIEASHMSLRLFYDSEESHEVYFNGVSIFEVDIEKDWCMLKGVTCDDHLGDKLNTHWKYFNDLIWKVLFKYQETRDVDKLNFIVSHPHGCCKKISFGHWVGKYQVTNNFNRFTYTTCTCPGSSGASVHCVGYGVGWRWSSQHVHSGSLNSKLNYSGIGEFF
ncbi:hypothetical protein Btru_011074 [Bulinus truncatus]|nr:hypothetical protein Btru_011074 [Bulinus truncatus]